MEQEAMREVVNEAECTTTLVDELAEQCEMLLRDLAEEYFGNGMNEDRLLYLKTGWHRLSGYIGIAANLQGQIQHLCEELEAMIEKALNCESKKEGEKKNEAAE